MICKSCGAQLDDSAMFCTNCGMRIEKAEAEAAVAAEEVQAAVSEPAEIALEENMTEPADTAAEIAAEPVPAEPEITAAEEIAAVPESAEEVPAAEPEKTEEPNFEPIQLPETEPQPEPIPAPVPVPEFTQPQPAYNEPAYNEPVYEQPPVQQHSQFDPPPYNAYAQQTPPIDGFSPVTPPNNGDMMQPQQFEKKQKNKVGVGKLIASGILVFLSIVIVLAINVSLSLKIGATGSILEKRIKKLDLNTILSAQYDGADLSTDLYRTIGFGKITQYSANENTFKEYLLKSNALEFVGGHVKNYADYIFDGKGKDPSLDSQTIAEEFFNDKENQKIAQKTFNYKFSTKDINTIASKLEKNDVDKTLSIKEWEKSEDFNIKNVSNIFSFISIGILGGIVLLFLIIIILILKSGRHIMGAVGNTFCIGGLITFIVALAIVGGIPLAYALTSNVVIYIAANVTIHAGVLLACLGFGEMFIGCIFKCIQKGLKNKAKANA